MARRNKLSYWRPEMRSSLGDQYVQEACNALGKLAGATVATMTHYEHSLATTLPMIFRDDDLEKLKKVRGMVTPSSWIEAYPIQPTIDLNLNFQHQLLPTITQERFYPQPGRVAPLLNYVAQVKAIHDRFEEAKAVLRWLNRNATPGAIRFYWPTAMKLCPSSPIWRDLQDVPSRYSNPPGLSDWMQSLKDAATTCASSLLLPTGAIPKPRADATMWLTFSTAEVRVGDGKYQTDQMTYYV